MNRREWLLWLSPAREVVKLVLSSTDAGLELDRALTVDAFTWEISTGIGFLGGASN
jgi:hypothetical protein